MFFQIKYRKRYETNFLTEQILHYICIYVLGNGKMFFLRSPCCEPEARMKCVLYNVFTFATLFQLRIEKDCELKKDE